MSRDDERDEEILDLGVVDADGPEGTEQQGSRSAGLSRRGVLTVAGVAAVGAVGYLASRRSGTPSASSTPRPSASGASVPGASPSATGASPSGTTGSTPSPSQAGPVVTSRHPALPGAASDWEVLAVGSDQLVKVHPASGRVTTTNIGSITNDSTVSLVPLPGHTLVYQPGASVGTLVPDDAPPMDLSQDLMGPGQILPGPDPEHVWVQGMTGGRISLTLHEWRGGAAGRRILFSRYGYPYPDGAGQILFVGVGGTYRAGPGPARRLTTGYLVAVGATACLTVDCDDQAACRLALYGRDGVRHDVPGDQFVQPGPGPGAVSPDGRTAAVFDFDETQSNGPRLKLLDLGTGRGRAVDRPMGGSAAYDSLAWSPDSRWLLLIDSSSHLAAYDTQRGTIVNLAAPLPTVDHIAVRRL